jgi:hypothetical protein
MAGTVDWARIKLSASRKREFFLNSYPTSVPRLRIEEKRGGDVCYWHARTTINNMEETKRYLNKAFGWGE